ncbi:hypothetical protein [Vibrio sp. 10N.239.312.D08]|uniref:hypothetical protein n=1 Tax=Vibrio sp. 10N.239.312.D08 TaxID=3229978 RepID=UPI003553B074
MTTAIKLQPFYTDDLKLRQRTHFKAFKEELNEQVLLKDFSEKSCCTICKSEPHFTDKTCACVQLTSRMCKLMLKHLKPEFKKQSMQMVAQMITLYLPTCVDSMIDVMTENNANELENGLAEVTIKPLKAFDFGIEHQNLPIAVFVNDALVFVSTSCTYSSCSRAIETYMNSY